MAFHILCRNIGGGTYQSLMDAHYGTHSRVLQYIGYKVSLRVIVVVEFQIELCFNVMANLY